MMRHEMLKTPVRVIFSMFVFAMLVLSPGSHAQGAPTPAGKVVFAMGAPHAVNASGVSRPLAKGDPVYSGDQMITGRGRLQLSMIDGAFISVQPNSEYVIDTYHFDGKPDGTEQATYRLVKGGVRAVTGLIGRVNKDAYKVNTAVATIGIRGTGHNTRLCNGDCGKGVKNGLYHNTWEGITYVVNDVDTVVVPAGEGVYVQSIDTPIIPLNQAPGVTAAVTKKQDAQEQEKQDQQTADQTTVVAAGDQRTSTGTQVVVSGPVATPSHVVSGIIIGGIHPDDTNTGGVSTFGLTNASAFLNPTTNGVIGVLGTDDSTTPQRGFGTIDYNSALAGDDPTAVAEAGSLLDLVDQTTKDTFLANPAQLVENTTNGNLGWGRWANGYFLAVSADGNTFLQDLTGNASLHYIYGPPPGTIPTSGTAFYNFIGGTHSTSLSGATIGNGVTDGAIYVDFGAATAGLRLNVDHNGNMYFVHGKMTLDSTGGMQNYNATATTTASGSACNPSCGTSLDAHFIGSDVASHPVDIGLMYQILETDPIMGVAAFATDNVFSSITAGRVLTYAFPTPSTSSGPFVAYGTLNPQMGLSVYQIKDSSGNYIGNLMYDSGSGTTLLTTIDLYGVLDNNDSTFASIVSGVTNALGNTAITSLMSNPAQVLESGSAGAVSLGRWGNGNILFADNSGGGYTLTMQNDQSYHFIDGPDPGTLPTGGAAYYKFAAGTQSTTASGVANASGASLGSGVTDGTVLVNFLTDSGSLDMTVQHGNQYHVTGPLILDPTNNLLFDGGGTTAATTAAGSACNPDCPTYYQGGLIGPTDSTSGLPANLGLYYEIQENDASNSYTDPIMGAAVFAINNTLGSVTAQPYVITVVQPSVSSPGQVDFTNGYNAILHSDPVSGAPLGAIISHDQQDPTNPTAMVTARAFGTVNLVAMQNSDNPAAMTELNNLVTQAGTTAVSNFETNPASATDYLSNGSIGLGRWTNGKVLTYNDVDGSAEIATLTGNQSFHFIYGVDPGPIPTTGSATYTFGKGTQSTSLSGATIGNGVTSGSINVNFASNSANLSMVVDHVNTDNSSGIYNVNGPLALNAPNNGIMDTGSVFASGGTGACASSCGVDIQGGFAGPASTSVPGTPSYIGIGYAIHENDIITGVAGTTADTDYNTGIGGRQRLEQVVE